MDVSFRSYSRPAGGEVGKAATGKGHQGNPSARPYSCSKAVVFPSGDSLGIAVLAAGCEGALLEDADRGAHRAGAQSGQLSQSLVRVSARRPVPLARMR